MSGELDDLRERIVQVDGEIIALLARRYGLVDELADLKRRLSLPVEDPERESALRRIHAELARREGVHEPTVERIFTEVLRRSKARQEGAGAPNE